MYQARCVDCDWTATLADTGTALDALHRHVDTHLPHLSDIQQMPTVTFRQAALDAIRRKAATGVAFTIGEVHDLVPVRPLNPRTEWAAVTREAAALGLIEPCGYTESVVPTTKGSAVKLWRRPTKAA